MARCSCVIMGEGIQGELIFTQAQEDAHTVIDGTIEGLTPSSRHAIHIHTFGDMGNGMVSAGSIFNPFGKVHGGPTDEERMVGDCPGNVETDGNGTAVIHFEDRLVKLIGPHSIIGRSVVVKQGEDDEGRGGHELSLSSGNSGPRIAAGVIGIASS